MSEGSFDFGSEEELEAQAATQAALDAEREEVDSIEPERTASWLKNAAWDGDTSFLAGLFEIGLLVNNTVPVVSSHERLIEYGELSEEVLKREIELSITDRVLIYGALQVFGIVSGTRFRAQMDPLLSRLEALVEPTELEEEAFTAAELLMQRVWQEKLKEQLAETHPDVGVYTPEEFAQEMANRETEDETIKRLQAEQDADFN